MKEKILLIEDNLDLIEIMRVFLTYRGYRVLVAQTGSHAIESAKSELPDLVITDIVLEEMDGVQIALQLRKDPKTCHIPILALTAKTFSESESQILPSCLIISSKNPLIFISLRLKFTKS